uniref:Uncharacterized protein n=1 Tax=Fomitiporia mediterranea TaxID=208960 RepID=A0A5B9RAY3_9AGAM|nr:hypothetical protein Fomme_000086 [Fomitiporia mediterranea]QEG57096.1 hypothetical protein Fomme_000086 [Fomitiporia mediterranea]
MLLSDSTASFKNLTRWLLLSKEIVRALKIISGMWVVSKSVVASDNSCRVEARTDSFSAWTFTRSCCNALGSFWPNLALTHRSVDLQAKASGNKYFLKKSFIFIYYILLNI